MQNLRQAVSGLMLALASSLILLGGFSLAFVEGGLAFSPSVPVVPEVTNTVLVIFPSPAGPTPPLPTAAPQALPTDTPYPPTASLPTNTAVPPISCPPPPGWVPYTIYPGDTLAGLSQRFGVSRDLLAQANCLYSDSLLPGYTLYVPPAPTATRCSPPPGWVRYVVQPGDNLYRIGLSYGMSAADIQRANCLPSPNWIVAGSSIYVPNIPTLIPVFTFTPLVPPTMPPTITPLVTLPPPTATNTPLIIILLPTDTPTPPPSPVPSLTPTPADIVIPTDTIIPTLPLPEPSLTPTP